MSETVHKRSILVIDDNKQLAENYENLFRLQRWLASSAFGGEEAVKLIGKQSFDAILLDMRMPEMDGFETLARILEVRPNACVIFFTAYGNVESAIRALREGAWSMIIKGRLFEKEILPQVEHAVDQKKRLDAAESEKLAALKRETEQSARLDASASLSQGIAHQFHNEIVYIGSQLEEIDLSSELNEARSYVPDIYESLETLSLYVNDLGHLGGAQQMEVSLIDAAPLINQARDVAVKRHAHHGIPSVKFVNKIDSKPVEVCSNEGFLMQAFECVISNAIEAMINQKERVITVKVERKPREVIITFEDTGTGFAEETLSRAHLAGFTSKGSEGMRTNIGLGLTFVKTVIEQSGGTLAYGNRERPGARISIILPLNCKE